MQYEIRARKNQCKDRDDRDRQFEIAFHGLPLVAIADAPDRHNVVGLFWIGFNFLPQPFDVDRQRLRLGKAVKAPNLIEQIILIERFAAVFSQKQKQVKFLLRQVERVGALVRDPLCFVDFQKAVGQHIGLISPREDALDFGKQNVDVVWLFYVIVCA